MDAKTFLNVPNLLILSYRVFLTVSALGLILASFNFGYGPVREPPKAPLNISSIEWTPNMLDSDLYHNYTRYVEETEGYGTYRLVPEFYVLPPCGVGLLFSGTFVVADIFLKDLKRTTVSLYSSIGLLSMAAGFTGAYQTTSRYLPSGYEKFLMTYSWVTTVHSLMLGLLMLQIVLSIWELWKQKILWPTIHFSHLLTFGLVARAVLVTFATNSLIYFFVTTVNGSRYIYDDPVVRFPEYLFMPCAIAGLHSLLVSFEALSSQIFGHVHNRMMGISGIVMTLNFAVVTVIWSPPVSDQFVFIEGSIHISMIFSIICLCISIIYVPLCFVYPSVLNTPPAIIRYLAYTMAHMKCTEESNKTHGGEVCACRCSSIYRGAVALWKNLRTSNTLRSNLVLTILSFVCMTLLSASWTYNDCCVVMLCSDISILYRTFSAFITELATGIPPDTQSFQVVFLFFLEATPLLIGLIMAYFTTRDTLHIVAIILNIIIIVFQFYKVQTNSAVKTKIAAALETKANRNSEVRPADEEQPMAEGVNGDASTMIG